MTTYSYRAIYLLLVFTSIEAVKHCDQVDSQHKERCMDLVHRWNELKDEHLKKCCSATSESISVNRCTTACYQSAAREATAKLKSEFKADPQMNQTSFVPQVPVSIEERISFGQNRRNFRVFKYGNL